MLFRYICVTVLMSLLASGFAAETKPVKKDGLQLRLVSDQNMVIPGGIITVGLFLEHEPTYHTYWKAPGIVGVPTQLKWELPTGFSAAEIQWPAPQRTKMAQLTAYGYETDTCLLTEITVPKTIEGESVTLKVRAGWMCCASACHPDWQDFEFTLPVSKKDSPTAAEVDAKWAAEFEKSRALFPKASPAAWQFTAKKAGSEREAPIDVFFTMKGEGELPEGFDLTEVYFFCNDNQVNSDEAQIMKIDPDRPRTVSLRLAGTDFGPENAKSLSGVLFYPKGWPGLDSKWIEVSTSWPEK
ncbi:MAG: protein-disulfide reductase DsbD domain-containing protein [Verrucomicrobiales bacterium]